jgi:cyclophilin family peptidyl-prolyl cis-trans isomerase
MMGYVWNRSPPRIGGLAVPNRLKPMVACIGLLSLALATGCGRSGDGQSPAASINGNSPSVGGVASSALPKPSSDPKHPVVQIQTSLGNITVCLDAEKSPLTVDNFLSYVEARHYDQTIVHQAYKGQGFLAGGYGVNMLEKPGRTPVMNEAHNGLRNVRGTISMVRAPSAIDSATCQFFVNITDNPALDHKGRTADSYGYCVFGTVTEGMDVVDRIAETPVHDTANPERTPIQQIVITSVRRIR